MFDSADDRPHDLISRGSLGFVIAARRRLLRVHATRCKEEEEEEEGGSYGTQSRRRTFISALSSTLAATNGISARTYRVARSAPCARLCRHAVIMSFSASSHSFSIRSHMLSARGERRSARSVNVSDWIFFIRGGREREKGERKKYRSRRRPQRVS